MNAKQPLIAILCGLLMLSVVADRDVFAQGYPSQQLPEMQMHVFGQTQAPVAAAAPVTQVKPITNDAPQLNMVVFPTGGAAATQAAGVHTTASDNLRLTYNDAGQVQVEQEIPEQDIRAPVQTHKPVKDVYAFLYEINTGYHQDNLSWSVASPTGSPNVLTAAQWDNIGMWRIRGLFDITSPMGFVFKGHASYSWVLSGSAQETAYIGDNQQQEFSSIYSNADNGSSWDASFGAGYQLKLGTPGRHPVWGAVTPLAGYEYQEQRLKMENGVQLLSNAGQAEGSPVNVNNTYLAKWYGPWLGLDAKASLFNQHELFSSFSWHWATYRGKGNWADVDSLQQPRSFTHDTDATGYIVSGGYRFNSADVWGVSLTVDYQNWDSDPGTETLFLSTGNEITSRFNEVKRDSLGLSLGVNFAF